MPIENLNDRDEQAGDLMEELAKLPLPPAEKLATYLKTAFGRHLPGMNDQDWLREAKELLKAIGER
jgi:hypothetical protein